MIVKSLGGRIMNGLICCRVVVVVLFCFCLYVYFILSPVNFYGFFNRKKICISNSLKASQSSCTRALETKIMQAVRESTDNEKAQGVDSLFRTFGCKNKENGF